MRTQGKARHNKEKGAKSCSAFGTAHRPRVPSLEGRSEAAETQLPLQLIHRGTPSGKVGTQITRRARILHPWLIGFCFKFDRGSAHRMFTH